MARIKSGTLVSGLTAAAIAVIAVLAAQAAGSAPDTPPQGRSASPPARVKTTPAPKPTPKTYPLPAASGSGRRVVYSISGRRVWLVGQSGRVLRTYQVAAGKVAPALGAHTVFDRRASGIGGDGAHVEHVVLFARSQGINVGFSAAVTGSLAPADPTVTTAAIRARRADAAALWLLATIGTTIQVVH